MRIAVVTGASSGLGREFVRQISENEAVQEIWVIARRKNRLQEWPPKLSAYTCAPFHWI